MHKEHFYLKHTVCRHKWDDWIRSIRESGYLQKAPVKPDNSGLSCSRGECEFWPSICSQKIFVYRELTNYKCRSLEEIFIIPMYQQSYAKPDSKTEYSLLGRRLRPSLVTGTWPYSKQIHRHLCGSLWIVGIDTMQWRYRVHHYRHTLSTLFSLCASQNSYVIMTPSLFGGNLGNK